MLKTSKDYTIYPLELLQIIQEAKETYTFVFSKPIDLTWKEGAHTHLALNRFNETIGWFEKKDVRHFSIMTLENEEMVGITTRLPQLCTDFKKEMKLASVGDLFYLFKVGSRLTLARKSKPILLISSGVGIASFRPLMRAYRDDPSDIAFMVSLNVDSSKEYLFYDELKGYETGVPLKSVFAESRAYFYENLKTLLETDFKEYHNDMFCYIVGSDEFLFQVRDVLQTYDISVRQMILDKKEDFIALFSGAES